MTYLLKFLNGINITLKQCLQDLSCPAIAVVIYYEFATQPVFANLLPVVYLAHVYHKAQWCSNLKYPCSALDSSSITILGFFTKVCSV